MGREMARRERAERERREKERTKAIYADNGMRLEASDVPYKYLLLAASTLEDTLEDIPEPF